MYDLIRIAALSGRVEPGSPTGCRRLLEEQLRTVTGHEPDVILLPSDLLLPPSAASLRQQGYLLELVMQELHTLALNTAELPSLLLVGLPVRTDIGTVSAMAALHRGKILGFVLPPAESRELSAAGELPPDLLPAETVFDIGGCRTRVLLCGGPERAGRYAELMQGCDCVLLPCYDPATLGSFARAEQAAASLSRQYGCAVAAAGGAGGDSSHPVLYRGWVLIAEAGEVISRQAEFDDSASLIYDLDLEVIRGERRYARPLPPAGFVLELPPHDYALRTFSSTPYLPIDPERERAVLREWFELQAHSLAARLQNTGIDRVVLGISGGLDSTLALLVCHRAARLLHIGAERIIAVTMPGFGTSDRTHYNALKLPEKLGMTTMDIPIGGAVLRHFEDIGHSAAARDITYENAQARERTQILLDLGNKYGAIVVGTGDLTEAALGWCTFGGDALAGYNVNVTVPKTAIRRMVALLAEEWGDPELREILTDILDTPISPELLPADERGEIAQKTEEILGDYEVHDFYLYYFIKYGFSPKKLLFYAQNAFDDRFSSQQLESWLTTFLRRFTAGQFKRSAAPESAAITDFGLGTADFSIPSDMSPRTLLNRLDMGS